MIRGDLELIKPGFGDQKELAFFEQAARGKTKVFAFMNEPSERIRGVIQGLIGNVPATLQAITP